MPEDNSTPSPFEPAPVLVVTIITPSFARWPYSAAAVAPLRTVKDSISSGFILCKPSPKSPPIPVPVLLLLIGTPLTTINGELSPLNDDWPRILSFDEPPGPVGGADTFN